MCGGPAHTPRRAPGAPVATALICALLATAAPLAVVRAQIARPATRPARPADPGRSTPPGAAGQGFVVVRCESFRLRQVACPAVSHANVKVARVLGGRCLPGLTWFYDRRAIHVRGGCRALFLVGGASQTAASRR